ncbi:hypothetical protein BC832DRAFT_543040 [Gaertneriomyces semiglobifer]|nr:hypothetical protein BC832DRAFT_543040 [Gaertneriomyces semiglobifer]
MPPQEAFEYHAGRSPFFCYTKQTHISLLIYLGHSVNGCVISRHAKNRSETGEYSMHVDDNLKPLWGIPDPMQLSAARKRRDVSSRGKSSDVHEWLGSFSIDGDAWRIVERGTFFDSFSYDAAPCSMLGSSSNAEGNKRQADKQADKQKDAELRSERKKRRDETRRG